MLKHALLITVLGFLVPVARADSFDMTQMTLSFEQGTEEDPSRLPRFGVGMNGPNASLGYSGAVMCNGCELPVQFFNPGAQFSPGSLFLNPDGNWSGELGGLVFDSDETGGGGLALEIDTFGSFVFPRAPVGSFTACVPAANTQSSLDLFGRTTSGNFVQDIVVNLPTNTGKYCTTWSFGTGVGESGWFLDSGRFTATVIPEPGTLGLLGTGFLGLAGVRQRMLKK